MTAGDDNDSAQRVSSADGLLKLVNAAFGAEHHAVAGAQLNALEELGRTLRMTRDLEGSKQALETAVATAQSIQGETVQTWRIQLELAHSLFALEQHGAAQALLREVADAYAPNKQRSPALERQLAELTALFGR